METRRMIYDHHIQQSEPVLKDHIKTNFIEKLSHIIDELPVHGKRNLIFLSDTSAVPFGWSIKEYVRFKFPTQKKLLDLSDAQSPRFFRIDVYLFKYESEFIKQYLTSSDPDIRQNLLHIRTKMRTEDSFRYAFVTKILPEKIKGKVKYRELSQQIEEAKIVVPKDLEEYLKDKPENIVHEIDMIRNIERQTWQIQQYDSVRETLKKQIKCAEKVCAKLMSVLDPFKDVLLQSTITIFDETLPDKVLDYTSHKIKGYEFKRTVSLIRFFLDLVCNQLRKTPHLYVAGLDISDLPWIAGMVNNDEDFNPKILKKLNSPVLYSHFVTPTGRYKAELRRVCPSKKRFEVTYDNYDNVGALILPRQAQEVPKLLIEEMKDIGRILYKKNEKENI